MHVYKELAFRGEKQALEAFKKNAPSFASGDWKYAKDNEGAGYISFDYFGDKAEQAEVSICSSKEAWENYEIRVVNIAPLQMEKDHLSIEEYNSVLDLFYAEIIEPNQAKMSNLEIIGPESDEFDPLEYISAKALKKLKLFSDAANKSTGSSHPCDEERWFDFICQTVDDERIMDSETLSRFLTDDEYWGKKKVGFLGVIGKFAWDEEQAHKLANEYENYVRVLTYYKNRVN